MKLQQLPIGSFYLVSPKGIRQVNLDSESCLGLTARSDASILSKDLQAWSHTAKPFEAFKLNSDESLVALDKDMFKHDSPGNRSHGFNRYFAVAPTGRFVEINMDAQSCNAMASYTQSGLQGKELREWATQASHGSVKPINEHSAIAIVAFDINQLKQGLALPAMEMA